MSTMFPYRRLVLRRGLGTPTGGTTFEQDLAEAQATATAWAASLRDQVDAALPVSTETIQLGLQVLSSLDFSSADAFMSSLEALASMFGPYGQYAGALLRFFQRIAGWLTSEFPAFTIQVQDPHFAWMSDRIAKLCLGFTGPNAGVLAAARGWVFFYGYNNHAHDAGYVGLPSEAGIKDSLIHNSAWDLRAESSFADPKDAADWSMAVAPGQRNLFPNANPSRAPDPMPTAPQIAVSDALWNYLGGNSMRAVGLGSARAEPGTAWVGDGLVVYNTAYLDIDSGTKGFYVYVHGFAVRMDRLPQQIVNPIATYTTLFLKAAQQLGVDENGSLPAGVEGQIRAAAFGPHNEAFAQSNLTRLIAANIRRNPVAFAAIAKAAYDSYSKEAPSAPSPASNSAGTIALVAGGAAAAGLALWLALK